MGEWKFEIGGLVDLEHKLKQLPESIGEKAFATGLRKAAKRILEEAKRRVPVDTGRLKEALRIKKLKRQNDGSIGFLIGTDSKNNAFGGDSWYGTVVEYGAPQRGIAGTFFLETSAAVTADEAAEIIATEVGKALDRAAKRAGIKWVSASAFDEILDELS